MSARPLGAGSTELGSNVIELGLCGIEFWAGSTELGLGGIEPGSNVIELWAGGIESDSSAKDDGF